MTDRELVLSVLKEYGKTQAKLLQQAASDMTSDEIVDKSVFIPEFNPERQYLSYKPGYICKDAIGNVVRLLQPYDSLIYTQQPEELPAQWGFYWSTDPTKAKPFLESATSPYDVEDCCTFGGHVWQSKIANNVWSPAGYPQGWTDLGPVENYQNGGKT